jgi:hypothetical protein
MFIIQLAVDNRWKKGKDPKDVLGEALADVIAPVTLTSVRALPGRLSALRISHSKSVCMAYLYGRAGRL